MNVYKNMLSVAVIALCALLSSCEKAVTDGLFMDDDTEMEDGVTVRFRTITPDNVSEGLHPMSTATRADEPLRLEDVCKRLTVAVFDESGTKIRTITQKSDDKTFGSVAMTLPAATYRFVFIAESGEGNPTVTSPEYIKFKDNKLTDTFYCCQDINLVDNAESDIVLRRATAMFRLVVNDATPEAVKAMKFYYTGGSSTLDAVTGYGCVNSRQTEYRTVDASAHTAGSVYEVYTFPHDDGRPLSMTISATDAPTSSATVLYMREMVDVPVERNVITSYSGNFFSYGEDNAQGLGVKVYDQWTVREYEY